MTHTYKFSMPSLEQHSLAESSGEYARPNVYENGYNKVLEFSSL